jgi:signal transduction histidine kinase
VLVARGLAEFRRRFEEMDSRTSGEVIVAWIRVGMGITMIAVLATGEDMRYYPAAAWTVLAAAVAYSWIAAVEVTRQAQRGEVRRATAYTLTALDVGFIVALAGLTGITTSPMLPILIAVVVSQAVRYSLSEALLVVSLTTAALVPVILAVPEPALAMDERIRQAWWWTWLLVSTAVMAGALTLAADRAHKRRAQAEAAAEVEHRRLEEERSLRQRLEAIDQARKDFLHALNHDFRTPIASLESLSEALNWQRHPLSEEERVEVTALIGRHARQLAAMLAEVREVAITESLGVQQRVEIAEVYMPQLIHSAGAAAGIAHERLVVSVDPALKVLRTDESKVHRILTNLLDNANKHSPADEAVEVHLTRGESMVELAVLDRGPGIPPELASRTFEKFASFGEHRSSGLGMWIVSQFVAALGGDAVIEPRPGGGLVVRVRFPSGASLPPAPTPTGEREGTVSA